jgi:hypothetical protein
VCGRGVWSGDVGTAAMCERVVYVESGVGQGGWSGVVRAMCGIKRKVGWLQQCAE